jgi:parallel beta-helix repeat protein
MGDFESIQNRAQDRLVVSLLALAGSVCLTPGGAAAHTFCVTNASELQQALTDSSNGGTYNGENNTVYIASGTYQTGAGPFHSYSTAPFELRIFGGYGGVNCSSNVYKASLTKLSGHGATGVLSIGSVNGFVLVENLTIENGESGLPGAGLQVNYLIAPNASVDVTSVIIQNNHSTVDAGALYVTASGTESDLLGNLIVNNSADGLYGAGYFTGYSTDSVVANNTVARNTSAAASNPIGGLYIGGSSQCFVYTNVFWNNTGVGLYLGNSNAQLYDNDYGTLGGAAPGMESGSLSTNPLFVDANNGDFHLAGNSPLLGYSRIVASPNLDLDGHFRPVGRRDVGAYYETIFIDGFEP